MRAIIIGCAVQTAALGRAGENRAAYLEIDASDWAREFPGGALALFMEGADGQAYNAAVERREGDVWTHVLTAADLRAAGNGRIQMQWMVGDQIARSRIVGTVVLPSIDKAGAPPEEPEKGYLEQMATIGAQVQTDAERAEQAADRLSGLGAEAQTLEPGSEATVTAADGKIIYGIPRGNTGAPGPQGPQGEPGADGVQINDGAITAAEAWSSRQIVDTLCPAFEMSGNPVVCYPVGCYPLGVRAKWEPMQEGAGDPSPDNVRPITGRDSVEVTRCGENLLNVIADETIDYVPDGFMAGVGPYPIDKPYMLIGVASSGYWTVKAISSYQLDNGQLTALTTSNGYGIGFNVNCTPNTEYIFHCAEMSGKPYYSAIFLDKYGYYIKAVSFNNLRAFTTPDGCYNLVIIYRPYPGENAAIKDIQLELGATPTTYAPYTGVTRTLTLPSTIYGGAVDVGTGAGVETWGHVTVGRVSSATVMDTVVRGAATLPYAAPMAKTGSAMSSYLPERVNFAEDAPGFYTNQKVVYLKISKSMLTTPDMDGLNTYLAAHPLDVCSKLAEPQPFAATGGAQITALAGANTLLTDADSVTVTGRADPIHTIQALSGRVAALENAAVTNDTGGMQS